MTQTNVLHHLGIILDGNRRFAKKLMLQPSKGHELGYEKIKKLFNWCKDLDIKELTLYTFSIENFNRPKKEFDYLMNLFKKAFKELLTEKELKNIKIDFIGRIKLFPKEIQERIKELKEKTKNNKPYKVNFAMAYGGRAEIVDATKKIAQDFKDNKIKDITEETFKNYLYLQSEPDLIIRTSERRLSGFLLWQSSYSEILFLPNKLWPEFEKQDLVTAVQDFNNRHRRFGK